MNPINEDEKAIIECYRRMYQNATPKADFDELIKQDKEQFYMDYEIDAKLSQKIINDIADEFRFNDLKRKLLSITINLGCSPRFKK